MKTHNEQYSKWQDIYLTSQNQKDKNEALSQMYLITKQVITNYINDYLKKHQLTFDFDTLQEKIEIGTLYVIERYLTNPDFKIEKISAYAYFGKIKALFKDKEREQRETSLEEMFANGEKIMS